MSYQSRHLCLGKQGMFVQVKQDFRVPRYLLLSHKPIENDCVLGTVLSYLQWKKLYQSSKFEFCIKLL